MTGIKTRPDGWVNPFPKSFYSGEENAPDNIWQPIFSQNTLNGLGHDAFEAGADALITAGYRPVPSLEKLAKILYEVLGINTLPEGLVEIRERLLEGDKDEIQ